MYVSASVKEYLIVCFTYSHNASTWPLLWWSYDDVMVCWMFILLQEALNATAMKFVPTSEMIVIGSPFLQKLAWSSTQGCLLRSCLLSSLLEICCGYLQFTGTFYH